MIRFIKLALSILFIALLTTSCEKELSDVTGNLPGTGIDTTNSGGGGTSCGVPSGLSGNSTVSGEANISWTAVTGASSYNVQYKAVSASSWTPATSNTNSTSITGLTAGTTYEFQVQTVCSSGNSSYSASYTFTTATIVLPSVCKACSYQPWCDGSTYNYIDTTDGVAGPAAETIEILGDTMIGMGGSIMHYDVTLTNAGDTVYHNCDSVNQISTLILNINQGGAFTQVKSVLIKSNLPVGGTWTDNTTISGAPVTINYSIIAKQISRTVLGTTYNNVIKIHQTIVASISLFPPLPAQNITVTEADFYYQSGIGLIESLTISTFPGSLPSTTHRVLQSAIIP